MTTIQELTSPGLPLMAVLQEKPSLQLEFYSYGIMLRKCDNGIFTEYAVSPAQMMQTLAPKIAIDTGLLSGNTLLVRQQGIKKTVVEYRPPQKTGIYLDDVEQPLRIALPGLILIRVTTNNQNPNYQVYAVKKRPETLDTPLFHAPLPNIYSHGSICWGSVRMVDQAGLQGSSLDADWRVLLGSRFGNHVVGGKSKSHSNDIRQKYVDMEKRKSRVYPKSDLLPAQKTLANVIGE